MKMEKAMNFFNHKLSVYNLNVFTQNTLWVSVMDVNSFSIAIEVDGKQQSFLQQAFEEMVF